MENSPITSFSSRLQQALKSDHNGNFVYSPLGVSILMAMAKVGATGKTAQEIAKALCIPEEEKMTLEVFSNQLKLIKDVQSDSFKLEISQNVFLQKGYSVNPEYLEKLVSCFDSGLQLLDFERGCSKSNADEINRWIEKATQGKLKNMFTAESVEAGPEGPLRLVLINTVYFHGKWKTPFRHHFTRKSEFFVADGRPSYESISVDMMNSQMTGNLWKGSFEYARIEEIGAELVKVPYQGGRFSMLIFVPNFRHGLSKVEQGISKISVKYCLKKLEEYWAEMKENGVIFQLSMPKFQFETEIKLIDSLKKMGIETAFDLKKADFSSITNDPEGLYISDVSQKAIIEVDVLGTTAAAATGALLSGGGCPEYIHVKVDRSFYFQIVDEVLELVIFSGAVMDPSKRK